MREAQREVAEGRCCLGGEGGHGTWPSPCVVVWRRYKIWTADDGGSRVFLAEGTALILVEGEESRDVFRG